MLLRRPGPLPWAFAYAPRGPVLDRWDAEAIARFTELARAGLRSGGEGPGRVSHLRIDPEIERGAGPDAGGAVTAGLAAAGWEARRRSSPSRRGSSTSAADEDALWGDLRKKWRQYVNKARTGGVRVVDAGPERLDDFYRIYRETADRAGFLIRAQSAYRDVWDAFGPYGRRPPPVRGAAPTGRRSRRCSWCGRAARRRALRRHDRRRAPTVAPTTCSSGRRSAARRRRAPRPTTCGGSPTPGSRTSRLASGGARSRYVGAWDLVLDPFGRRTYSVALRARVRRRAPASRPAGRRVDGVRLRGRRRRVAPRASTRRGGRRVTTRRPGARRRRARRLGRAPPSTRRVGTSSSRGRGRRTGRPAGGGRGSSRSADVRALALVRRGRWSAAGPAYLPRGPVGAGTPWTGDGSGAAIAATLVAASRPTSRPTGIDVVAADPEVAADDTAYRDAPRGRRLPRDPGDPALAPPDVAGAARRRRWPSVIGRRREGDAPADPARGARRGRGAPLGSRAAAELEGAAPATEPAAVRAAALLRPAPRPPATGAASGSAVRPSSSPGGCVRWRPATSSTSRRARARADGDVLGGLVLVPARPAPVDGALRRRAERRQRPPGRDAPAPLARDRARPRRAAERDGPRRRGRRRRATRAASPASRPTACTSTSARSARPGWPSPGPTSASRVRGATPPDAPPRAPAGPWGGGAGRERGPDGQARRRPDRRGGAPGTGR